MHAKKHAEIAGAAVRAEWATCERGACEAALSADRPHDPATRACEAAPTPHEARV